LNGNGSAMRVSALAWLIDDMDTLMREAKKSAEITHNHPEGIKGAQAIAAAVFLARYSKNKEEIKKYIEDKFGYDLKRTVKFLQETYQFDVSCQGSVPEAIICFLESSDFEDCIRTSISIGGDSDTIASMAGAIAEAFYKKIPNEIISYSVKMISKNKKYMEVFEQFRNIA
jgi:ADP-ribosylglycohydrolase